MDRKAADMVTVCRKSGPSVDALGAAESKLDLGAYQEVAKAHAKRARPRAIDGCWVGSEVLAYIVEDPRHFALRQHHLGDVAEDRGAMLAFGPKLERGDLVELRDEQAAEIFIGFRLEITQRERRIALIERPDRLGVDADGRDVEIEELSRLEGLCDRAADVERKQPRMIFPLQHGARAVTRAAPIAWRGGVERRQGRNGVHNANVGPGPTQSRACMKLCRPPRFDHGSWRVTGSKPRKLAKPIVYKPPQTPSEPQFQCRNRRAALSLDLGFPMHSFSFARARKPAQRDLRVLAIAVGPR